MVCLVVKLIRSIKFTCSNSEASSPSLLKFRSKITNFLTRTSFQPAASSGLPPLGWFHSCFELINVTNNGFSELLEEINYPMSKWGIKTTDEYLNYTLNLLELLNSISSYVTKLNQVMFLGYLEEQSLVKIPKGNFENEFKLMLPIAIGGSRVRCSRKERVLVEAMMVVKKISLLVLALVLSGLCGDTKPYIEIRECLGGFEDSLVKSLDSICNEVVTEVTEKVNVEVMANLIEGINKLVRNLFSETVGSRYKMLYYVRNSDHGIVSM